MRKLKFIVLAAVCFAMIVSTYVGINTSEGMVGDISLTELINTPDANASCLEYGPVNNGRCGISNNCFWNDSYNDCNPWAPNS